MNRFSTFASALLVVGMALGWLAAAPSSARGDAPTTEELRRTIQVFLGNHRDIARDPDWSSLTRLVRIEPDMATVVDGRIHVVAKTLWKLPTDQATDAVRGLEKLLAAALTEASTASRQYRGRHVADWVRESSITVGSTVASRRLSEVSDVEIIAAVHDYVAALDRTQAWGQRGLQQLQRDLWLAGRGLGIERVTIHGDATLFIHWKLGVRAEDFWPQPSARVRGASNRARRDRANQDDFRLLGEFNEEVHEKTRKFVETQEAALRRLIVQGLTEHPFAGIAAPLIESLEQATIDVSGEVEPPAELAGILEGGGPRAAGIAGGNREVRTEAGNQAAGYSFRSVEFEKLKELPTGQRAELERQTVEPATLDAPVRRQEFTVDLQSYHGGTLAALAFSPDGRRLAAAGDVVRIWNLDTGELEHTLRAGRPSEQPTGFRDIVFSPDGKHLIAAMTGVKQRLWVYETGDYSEVKFTLDGHDEEVDRLGISDNGRYLATADIKGRVFLWDWAARRKIWGYQFKNPISRLTVSDFDVLVIDKTLDFARIPVDRQFAGGGPGVTDPLIELMLESSYPGDQPKVFTNSVAVSEADDVCVIGGRSDRDGETRNYNWCAAFSSTGRFRERAAPKRATVDHKFQILACALSKDSKYCASGDVTGLIQVWDARTGEVKRTFQSVGKGNLSVAFGDSLNFWQFGRDRYRGREWQYNHWAPLHLRFDFEKRILSTIDAREPNRETVRDGRELSYVFTSNNHRLSLLENNQSLASVELGSKARWQLFGYGFHPVNALETGYGVIVCSEDGGVMCLDPKTLRPRRSFVGHKSRVWNASASRGDMEGKRLITTGTDGIIHVWNLERFTPTYNVAALVDDDLTVTHLYPGTSTAERLAIGDRIETIDGLSPIEWLDSEKAKKAPDGPVPVIITRQGQRYRIPIELSEMGDLARPLVSAVFSEDGREWVVWTASGYFDCSPQASRWVGWVESGDGDRAARFIEGGQLRELKLRPDVVNLTLTLGDDQLALRQADANRNPNAPPPENSPVTTPANSPLSASVVPSPPKVRMLQPLEGSVSSTGEETIEIRAVVTAPAGRRPEIVFRVNEAEARSKNIALVGAPAPQLPPPPAGFEHFHVGQTVSLRIGPNVIQVIARLPHVQSQEGMSFVTVERRAPTIQPTKPTLHWCSIAVNDYQGTSLQSLMHARNDVEKVAEALAKRRQSDRFPYRDVRFHQLVDQQATKQGVGDLFDALINPKSSHVVKAGDTVGIHISAHGGIVAGTDGYMLVPHGGDPDRPRATCVLWSEFVELANSLGRQNVRLLLFVDTCRAGGLGAIDSGAAKILSSELSGVIYSASGANQSALENSTWQHGAFSLALREALEGQAVANVAWPPGLRADDDQDGILDVRELESFVYKRVRSLTMDQQAPEHARPRMGVEPSLF